MIDFDASAHREAFPVAVLSRLMDVVDDWFLVGAVARDLVVSCIAGMAWGTETADVDIVIAVDDDARYVSRLSALDHGGGGRIRHRVLGHAVDVIAYGGIAPLDELEDGATTLDVTGMAETAGQVMTVSLGEGLVVRCAPLHSQVALKLVAWSARGATTD